MKNNIICIDLTKFNFEKLKEVSDKLSVKYDLLIMVGALLGLVTILSIIIFVQIVRFMTLYKVSQIAFPDDMKLSKYATIKFR